MRSNDAYLGFPHDVFFFTMIQELVARSLGIRVGDYHHFATTHFADIGVFRRLSIGESISWWEVFAARSSASIP